MAVAARVGMRVDLREGRRCDRTALRATQAVAQRCRYIAGERLAEVGEQFDLYTDMVTSPDGGRWVVEAQCPKVEGDCTIVIRSLTGRTRWRRTHVDRNSDVEGEVASIARDLEAGRWPD